MRTIKELLQLMLENKHLFRSGLCMWAGNLLTSDIINTEEYFVIRKYIDDNRPIIGWIRNKVLPIYFGANYYWRIGNIKPRIKWLKKHINKL